jgi:hypothetical protein
MNDIHVPRAPTGSRLALALAFALASHCGPVAAQSDAARNAQTQKEARELADKIQSQTGGPASKAPAVPLAKTDPCTIFTVAELSRRFTKVEAPKRDRSREKYGFVSCSWPHAGGSVGVDITLEKPRTAEETARGWIIGFVDPLKPGASKSVRVERVAGVGDEAFAIVEPRDAKKGVLGNVAYLITQRGEQQQMVGAMELATGDRAVALATLTELGKIAAGRL